MLKAVDAGGCLEEAYVKAHVDFAAADTDGTGGVRRIEACHQKIRHQGRRRPRFQEGLKDGVILLQYMRNAQFGVTRA